MAAFILLRASRPVGLPTSTRAVKACTSLVYTITSDGELRLARLCSTQLRLRSSSLYAWPFWSVWTGRPGCILSVAHMWLIIPLARFGSQRPSHAYLDRSIHTVFGANQLPYERAPDPWHRCLARCLAPSRHQFETQLKPVCASQQLLFFDVC